jgi:NADH-quinone oxidoreductase subunit L
VTALSVQLIVLLPALAAVVGLGLRRSRPFSGLAATGTSSAVLLCAVLQLASTNDRVQTISTFGPLSTGELAVPLELIADRTSAVLALAVAVVGLAVQVFSIWYLRDDHRYPVFAATVSLFLAGMLLVVQSGDLILTLVGWEVMGWCSYLLIGHVSTRESARRAAHKAFLVTRVADIGFYLGLVILAVAARSTRLETVLAHWGVLPQASSALQDTTGSPLLTLALVGIVVGVAGKSGLVPFHDWLPDAMEGPTPASALIHAATMVAAGTYVIARFHPMYAVDGASRTLLGVLAAVTMVWAAVLAFAQPDLKRMLAYSTLSQVAIMLSALAFAGFSNGTGAGLGHLLSHALFKSLLFLAVGWLSVLAGGTAFVALRGRARGRGALLWSIGIGLGALAGLPPLVGFFSKEGVLAVAAEELGGPDAPTAWVVLLALVVTVPLTAAYCTRAWLLLTAPVSEANDASTTEAAGEAASEAASEAAGATRGATAGEAAGATAGATRGATQSATQAEEVELAETEAQTGQAESPDAAASAGDDDATAAHTGRPITGAAAVTVSGLALLTVVGAVFLLPVTGGLHVSVGLTVVSLALVGLAFLAVRSATSGATDPATRLGPRWQERSDRGFGADTAYLGVARAVLAVARLVVVLDRDVVDAYPRGAAGVTALLGRAGERTHRGAPSAGLVALVIGVVGLAVVGVTVWH